MVINLSRFAQAVELDLAEFAGTQPRELFSQNRFPKVRTDVPYTLTIGPHGHYWLLLETSKTDVGTDGVKREVPVLQGVEAYADLLSSRARGQLQNAVLPAYLPTCRWYRSKARTILRIEVRRAVPVSDAADASRLLWVDVAFTEGLPETYVLPLQILPVEAIEARRSAACDGSSYPAVRGRACR